MEKLEDIINFKLYTYSVERFHYFESNDDTNYLEICVKQYLFKDVNLDYFEEFFNEIKGKTKEEFLEWLEEKADEQGSDLRSFLEEAEVDLEPIEETFFNENTGDEVKGGWDYLSEQNEFEFGLADSQPSNNEEYFIVEPNIDSHSVFKLANFKDAVEKADIIVFLVAHKEFLDLKIPSNKVVLDFCGINKK